MTEPIVWRVHLASDPERVYSMLTSDSGRERFWAERSRQSATGFTLHFINGMECDCEILQNEPPRLFSFTYFGSRVRFDLTDDGSGGTDLTVINEYVPAAEWNDVHAGWLNVLLTLKAAVDFNVDLRNRDPQRTWDQGYVDQ